MLFYIVYKKFTETLFLIDCVIFLVLFIKIDYHFGPKHNFTTSIGSYFELVKIFRTNLSNLYIDSNINYSRILLFPFIIYC